MSCHKSRHEVTRDITRDEARKIVRWRDVHMEAARGKTDGKRARLSTVAVTALAYDRERHIDEGDCGSLPDDARSVP